MIIEKYAGAVRSLSPDALQCVLDPLLRAHPDAPRPEAWTGDLLVDWCRTQHVSQAELVVGLARRTDPVAEAAVEVLIGRPIEKITPASLAAARAQAQEDGVAPPSPQPRCPRPAREADLRVVHLLVEGNPKREGTSAHVRFARYREGMTVAAFLAAGGTGADLKWDVDKGFVALGAPA